MMKEKLQKSLEIITNKNRYQMLRLLEYYYDCMLFDEEGQEDDNKYPEELTMALDERPSGIIDALNTLISSGVDLDEGDCFNPLMMSVGNADAAMTEYLIRHGANPGYWPDQNQDGDFNDSNYYYDNLDIAYLNKHWTRSETYINALMRTARVLVVDGKLGSYVGFCLSVDAERREITFNWPHYKF